MTLITSATDIQICFDTQKQAFLNDSYPSLKHRKQRLWRLKQTLLKNKVNLAQAVADDFGRHVEIGR